jgi:hypothetical protein
MKTKNKIKYIYIFFKNNMCSTGHTSIHDEDGEETQGQKQHKTKGSSSVCSSCTMLHSILHVAYVISAHLQHIGCFGHQPKWPCSTMHDGAHTQDGIS